MSFRFGNFVLDKETRQLTREGQALPISPKAFQLLDILIDTRPRVISKQELSDRLWPDVTVEEANIRNLIAEIRRAMGEDGREPKYIRTAHRLGYAFVGAATEAIGRARTSAARLVDNNGAHVLNRGENLIGRDLDCSVLLDSSGVSRHHCRITLTSAGAVLEDLGSKNGTWVNGQRITSPVELKDGDLIRVGLASLTFRAIGPVGSTASLQL